MQRDGQRYSQSDVCTLLSFDSKAFSAVEANVLVICALILVGCFFAAWAYPILGEVVVSGSAWSRALSDACALAAVFFSVLVFIFFVRALFL